MVAILKVTNSSLLHLELLNFSADIRCILHKVCLLHAFSTWQRFMLNANALVGDWQCFCMFLGQGLETLALNDSISVHINRWTPARYPGEGSGKKKNCARACMKQHIASLFLLLFIEENQWSFTRWCLPLSVTSIFFYANPGSSLPCLNEWKETWLFPFELDLLAFFLFS